MNGPDYAEEAAKASVEAVPANAEALRLGAEPPTVMRLSRKALAILGGVAGLAIAGALLYALQPNTPEAAENLYDSDRPNKSELVTGAPGDYGKVPKLGEPLPGDLGRPILAARESGEVVPVPQMASSPYADARRTAAEQARMQLAQEHESARASRLFLGGGSSVGERDVSQLDTSAAPQTAAPPASPGLAGKRRGFFERAGGNPESASRLTSPSSPNVLQAGSVIPAALITGVSSDLPNQVTAQVTQNVYDSPTGQTLLIPQGARLIGEYDSDIAAGQTRVLLAWDRLILPGGRSISLERLPGGDAAGMAGLAGRVDNHWGHMLKAAFISSLLSVGAELGASDEDDLARAIRSGSQDTVAQTGQQLVSRHVGIPPTITVKPGSIFRVIVTRDLVLEPVTGDRVR